jgi:hypothetical protein
MAHSLKASSDTATGLTPLNIATAARDETGSPMMSARDVKSDTKSDTKSVDSSSSSATAASGVVSASPTSPITSAMNMSSSSSGAVPPLLLKLRHLDLSRNSLTSESVAVLADALASNTTLHKLILEENCSMARGVVALAAALHTNNTLQELDLTKNLFGKEGAIALGKGLAFVCASLTSLRSCLTGCFMFSPYVCHNTRIVV